MVDNLFDRLEKYKLLENTYVIYTTDNGFHIGQHRLPPGKGCGYEEDINIPLVIRGPGISACGNVDLVTTHTDIAPTIYSLAGITPREDFDGKSIPVTDKEVEAASCEVGGNEHVNVEYWGAAQAESPTGFADYVAPGCKLHIMALFPLSLYRTDIIL
jgi:arylsulfatase A-like enzyme